MPGIARVDPASLGQGVQSWLGTEGPAWWPHYDEEQGVPVLVVTVAPPQRHNPAATRKSHKYNRHPARRRRATGSEQHGLLTSRAPMGAKTFSWSAPIGRERVRLRAAQCGIMRLTVPYPCPRMRVGRPARGALAAGQPANMRNLPSGNSRSVPSVSNSADMAMNGRITSQSS